MIRARYPNSNKCITIISPNFNKAKYISETIKSVIQQSHKNWELLIIDDGSTDNSINLINDFSEKDSRIKLIKRNRLPKGGSTCRNIGLTNAKGNYILFLDSDDLLVQDALEKRTRLMVKFPQLDFAVFPMGTFYKKIGDSKSFWVPPRKTHLQGFLKHDLPWSIMQPIWSKSFLVKLTGFDEDFPRLQDVELHTRALLKKEVNYTVATHVPHDCYYRIDEKRIPTNYSDLISKWVDGSLLYVKKMTSEIDLSGTNTIIRRKYLRGTIFSMTNQLLYRRRQNHISNQEKNHLLSKIISSSAVKNIASHELILLYISLTNKGFYRVKGFNYLFKKLFILYIRP